MKTGLAAQFSRLDREQAARREITLTRISGFTRRLLITLFLITITAVSVLQTVRDYRRLGGRSEKLRLADVPSAICQAVQHLADVPKIGLVAAFGEANHVMKSGFYDFEKALEKESFLSAAFIPRWQSFASGVLGAGNEKVFLGEDGWLYYRPDLDYLVGPPFPVDSGCPSSPSAGERTADPLPSLKALEKDLSAAGIRLIILPIPVKPMIEPEHLSNRMRGHVGDLQNASFATFVSKLRSLGVTVIDPTDLLREAKSRTGTSQYLKGDTHWTPEAMECVANRVASELSRILPASSITVEEAPQPMATATNRGDLAEMLDLPSDSKLFTPESVTLRPVPPYSEKAVRVASVLLLGDSFTRIYSAPDLQWGTGSGFAERLSEKLGQPIDTIAINAGGSCAVRQELSRAPGKLSGKVVVVYEFSMRELSSGDWKVIPIPKVAGRELSPSKDAAISVTGKIAAISAAPDPGNSPYRDFLRCIHLTEVRGVPGGSRELLVFFQALRDRKPTAGAELRDGKLVTLHLVPWSGVESQLGSLNRSELQGPEADLPDVYWCGDY
jgi:SGNH hydrolase-like domain, acetyltransferase AlgX